MRICRFDENRVGLVIGEGIQDVTDALRSPPAWTYPLPVRSLKCPLTTPPDRPHHPISRTARLDALTTPSLTAVHPEAAHGGAK
jgi:hypothetical protein